MWLGAAALGNYFHVASEEALGMVTSWSPLGKIQRAPCLLDRLRRTQRPGGMGAGSRRAGKSCILGGGLCRASGRWCAASWGRKLEPAWNEWDREPLPGYKSCDLEMIREGQSRHLKLKQEAGCEVREQTGPVVVHLSATRRFPCQEVGAQQLLADCS